MILLGRREGSWSNHSATLPFAFPSMCEPRSEVTGLGFKAPLGGPVPSTPAQLDKGLLFLLGCWATLWPLQPEDIFLYMYRLESKLDAMSQLLQTMFHISCYLSCYSRWEKIWKDLPSKSRRGGPKWQMMTGLPNLLRNTSVTRVLCFCFCLFFSLAGGFLQEIKHESVNYFFKLMLEILALERGWSPGPSARAAASPPT